MVDTRSIRTKLMMGIVIIFTVLIGAVWCIYQYVFSKYVEEEASKNIELLVQQTDKAVESSLSMIESSVEYFFMDRTLQDWINMESPSPSDELLGKLNMDEAIQHSLMTNSAWENDLMGAAYFYVDKYAFTFYSNGNMPIHPTTVEAKRISQKMQDVDTEGLQLFLPTGDLRTFLIGKSYIDNDSKDRSLNMVIAVDENKLVDEYSALIQYEGAEAYLADRDGIIYSSAGAEKIGDQLKDADKELYTDGKVKEFTFDGADYYIFGRQISKTGLWLLTKIPEESYAAAMTQIARQYVIIICSVLAAIFFLGMFAVYKGTAFLTDIERKFVAVTNGDYSVKLPDFKTSEFHELSRAFNGMTHQIDYLIHEVYEKELEVKKAELGFLQSQINPHFLFNTFAVIGTKAKFAGQEEIYRMIRAISTLLEAGFRSNQTDLIEIRKELEYVNCYLYIQKERFGNKLQYEIVISEDLASCKIPKLCLEPIVENAVIHGIEPNLGKGMVSISVSREEDIVLLEVKDDGVGFPESWESDGKSDASIGIKNTDKRLKLMFGEKFGVFIDGRVETGACVIIKIPYTGGVEDV